MNVLESEWRYSKPLQNAKKTNENESADFDNFDPKIWLPWQRPLSYRKMG